MSEAEITQSHLFTEGTPPPVASGSLFAEVVFDRPLDHAYSYRVPEELRSQVTVGKRVQAPFGKGDRPTVGYCIGLTETPPGRAVKDLLRVVDEEALLSSQLLRLTRWMADYYLCGWGQVLNAVVPAGAKTQSGTRSITLLEAVPVEQLPDPLPKISPRQTAALERLRQVGRPMESRALARAVQCGSKVLAGLVDKGLVRRTVQRIEAVHPDAVQEIGEKPAAEMERTDITLNEDQSRVWEVLAAAVRTGGFKPFLLHGVTGSGKTELYLRAIDEVVRQGKQALVLVPEISLTPQAIRCFRGRCKHVAVLHSHLSDPERGAYWRQINAGKMQVIVGARSAIFAPARNLGLIVIDEEHEGSFKQEATPRYHARDVAVMRARLENIPLILGSATPSLESWHNAQRGQYTLLSLPNRVMERPLPRVALVDLRHDVPRGSFGQALSPSLEHAMRQALTEGGQVILLLNRRGYSTHVHCPACGHVEMCRFCDLALTYHQQRDVNLCHYCGFEQEPPQLCPKCGRAHIRYQGLGTEKLEAEIEKKFPGYVACRMDSDTMKRPGSHGRLLARFRRGEVHILLGTQMIAKGLDFPNVTLVGVVNADVGLHLPDFRASERTFQLLAQVSGRAGRGPRGGKVIVQTFNTDHPAILLAADHDYTKFVDGELTHRRHHGYPPYQRLIRIILRSREQKEAQRCADQLAAALRAAVEPLRRASATPAEVRILGPAEAPLFRLKGYFRFHLQLQSTSSSLLHQVVRGVMHTLRCPSGVEYTVDVDPQNML